ncbi:hypothetical protein TTHERM_000933397 (macronuclear) [Tetrahymena thermophila SB210]|uniref:Uncharacterized protein n=1 Tax=Tetrahymena thermophila (strain SB210) TaxID=312017 RepID=W7X912_TETTS|nr:hypothetical protein TTHERM_000933397 [Tetrahymena thermophila SB210]EWS72873.1 hypothetical protein TTHERM_000933397 [Tetrahymena thermophila SB210]|eukprot:XP_012654601.1 hypothetical protein TTHERM_000933397 [Tetrahymena thermophila SB210]
MLELLLEQTETLLSLLTSLWNTDKKANHLYLSQTWNYRDIKNIHIIFECLYFKQLVSIFNTLKQISHIVFQHYEKNSSINMHRQFNYQYMQQYLSIIITFQYEFSCYLNQIQAFLLFNYVIKYYFYTIDYIQNLLVENLLSEILIKYDFYCIQKQEIYKFENFQLSKFQNN